MIVLLFLLSSPVLVLALVVVAIVVPVLALGLVLLVTAVVAAVAVLVVIALLSWCLHLLSSPAETSPRLLQGLPHPN